MMMIKMTIMMISNVYLIMSLYLITQQDEQLKYNLQFGYCLTCTQNT